MKPPLTDMAIRKAPPPPSGQYEIWDGQTPGFGIRISASGTRSFILLYRHNGKPRRMTLGRYPVLKLADARQLAADALRKVAEGTNPSPSREEIEREVAARAAYRVDEVVASFVKLHCEHHNRPVTARDTARILNNRLVSQWADRDIRNISRSEIVRLLDAIVEDGKPSAANHALSAIRKLFNWCVERSLLEQSPCAGVKKPTKDKSRDRVLHSSEVAAIWNAAEHAGFPFCPYLKLLLLTAQRRGEVAAMQWPHLDLEQATWSIPAELTKSNRHHILPLPLEACRIIASLPRVSERYVFAVTADGSHFTDFSRYKRQFDASLGLDHWTLHDLRRTAATEMARLGTSPHVVERILNHTSGTFGGVAGVYNRFQYLPEMREALERWAHEICCLADK